jgi:hypothetical protein
MKTRYATGRNYGIPQVITITHPEDGELFDFVTVHFIDDARNIAGVVQVLGIELAPYAIGSSVMREYDAGRYRETSGSAVTF